MHEFQCGSPACETRFSAPNKDSLLREMTKHVQREHRIPKPTKSILAFLEANTVREIAPTQSAG